MKTKLVQFGATLLGRTLFAEIPDDETRVMELHEKARLSSAWKILSEALDFYTPTKKKEGDK